VGNIFVGFGGTIHSVFCKGEVEAFIEVVLSSTARTAEDNKYKRASKAKSSFKMGDQGFGARTARLEIEADFEAARCRHCAEDNKQWRCIP